jgi:hypothetical protein
LSEEEEKKLSRLEKRLVANVGAPWMGAIQLGVGKHPQGVCLGNFDDNGAYP